MSNVGKNEILKSIEIDQKYIDDFVLYTSAGTKRMKEKFHKNAATERNEYINNQLEIFSFYKDEIISILSDLLKEKMPKDKSDYYDKCNNKLHEIHNIINYLNEDMSDSFKLGLSFLISSINTEMSLNELNASINKFINKFKKIGITLTYNDFSYTMFTEKYMNDFFRNINLDSDEFSTRMKDSFESIYWECPDIIMQIQMSLENIIRKYSKDLKKYTDTTAQKLLKKENLSSEKIIEEYIYQKSALENEMSKDEYNNLMLFLDNEKKIADFLDNSAVRNSKYNRFALNGDYAALDDGLKQKYNEAILELHNTLVELKKYYKYENILKDIIKKYGNIQANKGLYEQKEKEIAKEEKNRIKIYADYLKSSKKRFLKGVNKPKMKSKKLEINEHIKTLNQLYFELNELEIDMNIEKSASETSSIYDLFMITFSSFHYLEKNLSDFLDENLTTLEDVIQEYVDFIYNPHNTFLRKINAFTDYEIENVVADKYRLLGLNISRDDISYDNITDTLNQISDIVLIQNIEKSNITLSDINTIKEINSIISSNK